MKDNDGDENFNVYAVDPAAAPAPGAEAPASRDLTGLKGVRCSSTARRRTDPDIVYIGLNDRDKAWHDLYKLKISTGERTLVRKNTEQIAGWIFDLKDNLRLATRTADNGDTEILRVDADGFTKIYSCDVFETCDPLRFHKDGKRVYLETNKGDARSHRAGAARRRRPARRDGRIRSDEARRFRRARCSPKSTDELVLTDVHRRARRGAISRTRRSKPTTSGCRTKLPGKEIGLGSRTTDEQLWWSSRSSDTEPGETYLFDRKAKKLTLQYRRPREAAARIASPMTADPLQVVRRPGDSGVPDAAEGRAGEGPAGWSLPHGGPWARDHWGYNPHGAVLRQSRVCGADAELPRLDGLRQEVPQRGQRRVGQEDAGRHHLGRQAPVAEGTADPKRVGILGGSYGGYATLAGVAFTPDLYRAGGRYRRTVEPDHAAGSDSAVLGGRPQD